MENKKEKEQEQARRFLHQLLRHRYLNLIKAIESKFPLSTPEQLERLQDLITYEFIQDALCEENA